jgi:hypothetical protein
LFFESAAICVENKDCVKVGAGRQKGGQRARKLICACSDLLLCSQSYLLVARAERPCQTLITLLVHFARFVMILRGTLVPLTSFFGVFSQYDRKGAIESACDDAVRLQRCAMVLNCVHGRESRLHSFPPYIMSYILLLSSFGTDAPHGSKTRGDRMFAKVLALVDQFRVAKRIVNLDDIHVLMEAAPGSEASALVRAQASGQRKRRKSQ